MDTTNRFIIMLGHLIEDELIVNLEDTVVAITSEENIYIVEASDEGGILLIFAGFILYRYVFNYEGEFIGFIETDSPTEKTQWRWHVALHPFFFVVMMV